MTGSDILSQEWGGLECHFDKLWARDVFILLGKIYPPIPLPPKNKSRNYREIKDMIGDVIEDEMSRNEMKDWERKVWITQTYFTLDIMI